MNYPSPSPLLTDLYQLTMLAGYFEEGMAERRASFDLFFRTNPYQGSYAIFAGLAPALQYLEELRFDNASISYLESLKIFTPRFLDYLADFRFRGSVLAPPEGTVIFAHEPLLSVEGSLAEAQFVETTLLNIINFQILVATKAARISTAAGASTVLEFGLRRAQGPDSGLSVARAAAIGGIGATSNLLAGACFDLPVRGTHAHSWVMAFDDELSAFRAYAKSFPDNCVLLIDTYDTLGSGLPNALIVAKELRQRGYELLGVRLDSGDLAYLSRKAREFFDAAGFPEVKIVASNDLDEHVIHSIRDEGGCIDIYGVGTRLATCAGDGVGALGGVYKLVCCDGQPKMKVTSDITKATLPARKQLLRLVDPRGNYEMDVIALVDEKLTPGMTVYDPQNPSRHRTIPEGVRIEELRRPVMTEGRRLDHGSSLDAAAKRAKEQLSCLPTGSLRQINPHRYKVAISPGLFQLRRQMMEQGE